MNALRHILSAAAATALVAGLIACSPKSDDPGVFVDIPVEGWGYGSSIDFALGADTDFVRPGRPAPDSAALNSELALTIRHSDAYAYSNIWLELSYPCGDTTLRDTLDIRLADMHGKWFGNGIGPSYQFCDTITTRGRINDKPKVSLRHIMRVDTLHDVEQIGLKIVRR